VTAATPFALHEYPGVPARPGMLAVDPLPYDCAVTSDETSARPSMTWILIRRGCAKMTGRARIAATWIALCAMIFGILGCSSAASSPASSPDPTELTARLRAEVAAVPGVQSADSVYSVVKSYGEPGAASVVVTVVAGTSDRAEAIRVLDSVLRTVVSIVPRDYANSRVSVSVTAADRQFQVVPADVGFVSTTPSFPELAKHYQG
jgi:hypothetical protein